MEIPEASNLKKQKDIKIKGDTIMFNSVLVKCIEDITRVNKNTDKTFTIFQVPNFLLSYPSYSAKDCIIFLMSVLSRKNYIVNFISPNYIHIDWGSKKNLKKSTGYIRKFMEMYPDAKIEFEHVD